MYQAAPIDSPDKTLGRRAYLVGVGLFILLLVLAAGFVAEAASAATGDKQ